jgi:hypothetical protein
VKKPTLPDCYDYVRRTYGVPAYIGVRVRSRGEGDGVIVAARSNLQYIHVRFDARSFSVPCHPTDHIEYLIESRSLA